jgi:acyl-coenzyme A thioesterase PaaI-like protein
MPVTLFFFVSLWRAPVSGFSSVRSALNYRASMLLDSYLSSKFRCWSFYIFACYRGTGGRAQYVAEDWSEVHLDLPLSWRTRNYVGTIFGGSMYSAVDPIYMVMLIRRLGKDYVVWDKAASIQFKKPGRETLHARFVVTDGELAAIRAALETQRSIDRTYLIELKDSSGTVCATVEKLIYIRKR